MRTNDKLKIFLRFYLPALVWAGVIFYFSSIPNLRIGANQIYWEVVLRKFAHIGEYIFLTWLIFRIFYHGHGMSLEGASLRTIIIVIIYAASDEVHQTFVYDRSGKVIDVVLDSLSSFLGLQVFRILYEKRLRIISFFRMILSVLILAIIIAVLAWNAISTHNVDKDQTFNDSIDRNDRNQESAGTLVQDKEISVENNQQKNINKKDSQSSSESTQKQTGDIPKSVAINVPFSSQAPFGKWDSIHEESCEEASLIMVKYYLDKKELTPEIAEKELQEMVDFEIKNYGGYKDSSAADLVQLAKDFYGLDNLEVVYDIRKEDIKKYLAEGNPLILPAAGRELGNPNFTPPGPLYHMLVATGYNGNKIITNDPGTKKGKGYIYDIDILYGAIRDFTGDLNKILQGRKAVIVVRKQPL